MNAAPSSESVVVVGSGIVGIACAHYFSKAGYRVTVIDQGSLAGGCSHANCGYICPSHVLPLTEPGAVRLALRSLFNPQAPFRVKPRFSPSLWKWMWNFARRCNHRQMLEAGRHLKTILDSSMAEYRRMMKVEPVPCEWKESGLLYVFQSERGLREFAETDRLLTEEFGVAAQRIEGDRLTEFDPALKPGLAGAFHYSGDASVRPDLLNRGWIERLKERGVEFREQCQLTGIEKSSRLANRLSTSQGPLPFHHLVVATGAWSERWSSELECAIPVQPGKGYSVTMTAANGTPRFPMLFPEHRVGVSPFQNAYRLGSMMEFAGFDATIPERRIQQLYESSKPYLVTTPAAGDIQRWYGWRPMTSDSLPIIGRVPRLDNVYLATGHNMLGLSLATATGRLISELVQNKSPHIDPEPYSPKRFH